MKRTVLLMCIGAALLAAALHVESIGGLLNRVWGMILPAVIGAVMAFVLNVPMRGFEGLLGKLNRKKQRLSESRIRFFSMWLTLISLVLVIVFVLILAVPEIVASLKSLFTGIQRAIPDIIAFAEKHIDSEWVNEELLSLNTLQEKLSDENITKMIVSISNGAYDIAGRALTIATSTLGSILSISMSLIVAIYMLLSKKKLGMQTRKLLYAYLKKEHADKVCSVGRLVNATYAKFLSGQCVEAFIIAILLFVVFTLFRLPYASLVGVLAAVLSFIPYIGSWIACAIGALLICIISPWKALLSVVVYQVVQFLEGKLIYPRVVGRSVGLPPIYTLLAALLGGNLFGIVGIIFFIPFVAVVYALVRDHADSRLAEKDMKIEE
ncbi:MAG: AI-2E family transporter [bacterium]|nr:AI-2E family transporter [bacterium]